MAFTKILGPSTSTSGGGTSASFGITGTATVGDGIQAMVWWWDTGPATISNIACSGEADLTLIGSKFSVSIGGFPYGAQIAYLSNITAAAPPALTVNFSGSMSACGMCGMTVRGGDTTGLLGTTTQSASGNSAAPSVNIATANANEMILGMVMTNDGTQTPGSGYTGITLPNILWFEEGQYDLDAGAAGTKTFDFALSGAADWGILCASFKLAGGPPPASGFGAPFAFQRNNPIVGVN